MGSTEQEFEEGIEQLVSDTDLRKRLGNEGRKSAEARHDIEKTASRLGGIYEVLLSL